VQWPQRALNVELHDMFCDKPTSDTIPSLFCLMGIIY